MSNSNDSDRAYLIEKVFANFTKSMAAQWNDPNKDSDINYNSDLEHEPEKDYDAEYASKPEREECFASTKVIKPKE